MSERSAKALVNPTKTNFYQLLDTEKLFNNIFELLLKNDTLCKLVKYDTPDALSKPNLSLEDKMELIRSKDVDKRRITKTPVHDFNIDTAQVQLRIFLNGTAPDNNYLTNTIFCIQIIMANSLWELEDTERGHKLLSEVFNSLNGQYIQGIGVLTFPTMSNFQYFDKKHIGYVLYPEIRSI